MSLFENLFRLKLNHSNNPTEDFLTEVFTECLNVEPALLVDFLSIAEVEIAKDEQLYAQTQVTFSKLPSHRTDSRPDIVISGGSHLVFIEAKVDAVEGDAQLKRYAEHLNELAQTGTLIYLTRDYVVKNKQRILETCKPSVKFVAIRWFDVYKIARQYRENELINQLLKFMAIQDLSSNDQFSPLDIIALTNFSRVKRIIDEIMFGVVSDRFQEVAGGISQNSASMTQLRNHDRYVYYKHRKNHITIFLGFWMNSFDEDRDYPDLNLTIEVGPGSENYEEVKKIMRLIVESNDEWAGYSLNTPKAWAGIYLGQNMRSFMTDGSHVKAMQDYFLGCLNKFKGIEGKFKKFL